MLCEGTLFLTKLISKHNIWVQDESHLICVSKMTKKINNTLKWRWEGLVTKEKLQCLYKVLKNKSSGLEKCHRWPDCSKTLKQLYQTKHAATRGTVSHLTYKYAMMLAHLPNLQGVQTTKWPLVLDYYQQHSYAVSEILTAITATSAVLVQRKAPKGK